MDEIKREAATYDAPETDKLMTEELASRDDYGEAGKGQMGEEFHDYLEDSRDFGGTSPSCNQQELWNRFREYIKQKFQKKREVGKEPQEGGHPLGPEPLSEGYWQKPLPYVGFDGSRTFFEAMPAQKEGQLSPIDKVGNDAAPEHGFCGSPTKIPEGLARKLVDAWIRSYYYAGIAESISNPKDNPPDSWKAAFDFNEIMDALYGVYCSALPFNIEQIAKEEIAKHPLRQIIPNVSYSTAIEEWDRAVADTQNLDSQIEEFARRWQEESPPQDIQGKGPLTKVAIDQYSDHHVDVTFEFMLDEIKIVCTWDREDLPKGLDEAQTLSRVVQFLEKKLPHAFTHLEHASVRDIDLRNRTLSIIMPVEK